MIYAQRQRDGTVTVFDGGPVRRNLTEGEALAWLDGIRYGACREHCDEVLDEEGRDRAGNRIVGASPRGD